MPVETIKCQECGSADVTEFKTGSYVCAHCEAVFKHVSPAGSVAEPCVFCGSDSVATCKQCSRRVCNHCMVVSVTEVDPGYAAAHLGVGALHAVRLMHPKGSSVESPPFDHDYRQAFTGGPPRCMGCRHVDGKAEMVAAPQRAAVQEHAREVVTSKLRTSSDVDEIARLIVDGDPRTPADAYQAGWIKFAASSMREPEADVVTLKFSKSLFGGNWTETSRRPAWSSRRCRGSERTPRALPGTSSPPYGSTIWRRVGPRAPAGLEGMTGKWSGLQRSTAKRYQCKRGQSGRTPVIVDGLLRTLPTSPT